MTGKAPKIPPAFPVRVNPRNPQDTFFSFSPSRFSPVLVFVRAVSGSSFLMRSRGGPHLMPLDFIAAPVISFSHAQEGFT
jgi:hypothetical protein